jgi:hypothetical protein
MSSGPIEELARVLDREGVDYALIGGHAVNLFLEPRLTRDIDVTIAAGVETVERVRAALLGAGFAASLEVGQALPSGPDFLRFVKGEVVVEIQAAKTAFQESVVERATRVGDVRVATPEDLIVLKLIAHRLKDLDDLRGLRDLPSIDWQYVERWAREWQVVDRLDRLRQP